MQVNLYLNKREVYGNTVYYPACTNSKLLAQIAGTKTLTQYALSRAVLMGYELLEADSGTSLLPETIDR